MKVFISWSGDKSQKLAKVLYEWLPSVLQAVKPYYSPDGIEKGSRWSNEISRELEQSRVGIICLTRSNLQSPWLMFEAGALSKSVEKSRVIPILFGVETSELIGPLPLFQATKFNADDIKKMIKTINSALDDNALTAHVLDSVFEKWWPELESKVSSILSADSVSEDDSMRTDRDLLEEILDMTRSIFYSSTPESYFAHDQILMRPIDDIELSIRTKNYLKAANIYYVGDLVKHTEEDLKIETKMPSICIRDVIEVLASRGLCLGLKIDNWPPEPFAKCALKND